MRADDALTRVLVGCERLRRLPESRWRQPPMPPLGARAPQQLPDRSGQTCEEQVCAVIAALMIEDATARGVDPFVPDVPVFALADVLAALAKSVAERDPASKALAAAAEAAANW